ncbi:FecR family protein [Sinomicrobium weinanense]|uniref:DUF4974 domain-containing protein n=1 Tax=Sinomicrobium weinanense TaxID=2842200 RepID=A0A926Q2S4_9FLAO|nr:FecR family protein [Sinomicrobium weinanense]MBC9794980.1 DUF4974 domain-containing protein [Sinomicrobium weinanense]MBU3125159.1 DUF4974 domain-containing protein [Sinomicrobium weinanense]
MEEKRLLQYIRGELSSTEKKEVLRRLRTDPGLQKKFNSLKARYVAEGLGENLPGDREYARKRIIRKARKKKLYRYTGIAATVLLFLALSGVYMEKMPSFLQPGQKGLLIATTSVGDTREISLSDGTRVTLNANSELIYPEEFNGSVRNVELNGEAFFKVSRNEKMPFIVTANGVKVKVLGTSFNVKSYREDEQVETTLVQGKVEVGREGDRETVILKPAQKATYSKSGKRLKVERANTRHVTAWQEGRLSFDATPMRQVVRDLERKYGVTFVLRSEKLLNYKYTGTFNNAGLDKVLNLFTISSPITYNIKNKDTIVLEMK